MRLLLSVIKPPVLFLLFLIHVGVLQAADSELTEKYLEIKHHKITLLEGKPIHVRSRIADNRLQADIFAIKQQTVQQLFEVLSVAENWCQFVTLHLNIKACTYQSGKNDILTFYAGRKFYQPAESAFALQYQFQIKEKTNDYFKLLLSADEGPFSTSDYQIAVDVKSMEDKSIVHFSLAYSSSLTSRMGTSVYLSTIGSDKKGFSQQINEQGQFEFIQGTEGIIERNVMRYFLALKVFLKQDVADSKSSKKLASDWYDESEQYALQLHELDKKDYIANKAREFVQQSIMQNRINTGLSVFVESEAD